MIIHAPVYVSALAKLAADVVVWPFASILERTVIGSGSVVGTCVWIGRDCRIGDGARFNHGTFIPHGTVIGDEVFFGPGVILTDDKHPRAGNAGYRAQPPVIRSGASIGAGAIVLPGVTIGRNAMIGAGAVVTRDVDEGEVVTGLPARLHLGVAA